jgi:hypothetical protein
MGNDLITIFATVCGVFAGSGLTLLIEHIKKRKLIHKYSVVFSFELQQLKNELDHVIDDYEQLDLSLTGRNTRVVPRMDPNDFLLKWSFISKYPFLVENFEKLSLFDEETITSVIKIHSLLMEYEILKDRNEGVLLVENLRKAQTELAHAISLLQKCH